MCNAIRSRLGFKARQAFLKTQVLRAAKLFGFCLLLFIWLFDASPLGATIWAAFFALFIGVGAAYLTWDDAIPDQEVLQRLNRVNRIAGPGTAPLAVAGEQE